MIYTGIHICQKSQIGADYKYSHLLLSSGSRYISVERLEKVRCKVIYVISKGKLAASISDGDVRRYALHEGNVNLPVKHIANYSPRFLVRYEKKKINDIFKAGELYSVPIVNYNHEIF